MLHGSFTEHCWCSNPVVCEAGLRSARGFLDALAFCASAGLSNAGTSKLPDVKPVTAKATATINFRNARIRFRPVQIRASVAPAATAGKSMRCDKEYWQPSHAMPKIDKTTTVRALRKGASHVRSAPRLGI